MNANEFVKLWRKQKDSFIEAYSNPEEELLVVSLIEKLNLDDEQSPIFWETIEAILNDTFYTLLLGLDGSASIGDHQETYKIHDESGNLISECGDLEGEAGEYF